MRELSINYPKKQADEDTIKYYSDKYNYEQADKVREELKTITFGELDIKRARGQATSFGRQLGLLRNRAIIFIKREP